MAPFNNILSIVLYKRNWKLIEPLIATDEDIPVFVPLGSDIKGNS